jgi:2-C-methyl-D-erythritol 4-phosphate cytidylyltransferase
MKVALVIPAAGSGERLGRGLPKALVDVDGAPLLRRTLERLASATTFSETIVLAPPDDLERFREAVSGVPSALGPVRVLPGGATRQQSVAEGVAAAGEGVELIAVHDAARPLVDADAVRAVLREAAIVGAATVASRPSDSVRMDRDDGTTVALDRARLWLVETPQAFRREVLVRAHGEARRANASYTDDASLVEAVGHKVAMVASKGRNLKVTVEADLVLAVEILRRERD